MDNPPKVNGHAQHALLSITSHAADLRRIAEVAAALTSDDDVWQVLQLIVEAAAQSLGGLTHSSILLLGSDQRTLRHAASVGLPPEYTAAIDGIPSGPTVGACGAAVWKRKTIITEDLLTDPNWELYRDLARPYGLRAVWSVPLKAEGGQVLGTFAAYQMEPGRPTTQQLEMLELFAHLAAVAVAHAVTRTREKQLVEETQQQIIALEAAKTALQASESRFRALVEHATDLVVQLDEQGAILYASPSHFRILGYTPEQMLGPFVWQIIHPEDLPALQKSFAEGVEHPGDLDTLIFRIRHADGSWRMLEAMANNRLGDPWVRAVIVNSRDITEQVRAQEESEQARATAEELARQRSDFVAAASHELRTPLTAVVGYAELLRARWPVLNEDQRLEQVRRIALAATRQQRLVEDLLLLSQVETSVSAPQGSSFVVAAMVRQAVDEAQGSYLGQVILQAGPPILRMHADPDRALQIVANLLVHPGLNRLAFRR